jgi:tetratricopeptide (TPR) repeat protein
MSRKKPAAPGPAPLRAPARRPRPRYVRVGAVVLVLALAGFAAYEVALRVRAARQYRAASEALERYDYWEAQSLLDRYLATRPDDPEGVLLAAQTARRRGDFARALRDLRSAERCGAPAADVETERELLRTQRGDLAAAEKLAQFCAAHPNEPSGALALEVLIEGALAALRIPLARWAVDLWLEKRTGAADQAQGLVWHGRVMEFSDDFPQALADFQRAVELAPDSRQARLRLAEALIRREPREAVPHLEWLRRRRPDDPDVRLQSARLCRALGQPLEARDLLDGLLGAEPDKVTALVERGRVAMDLDRTEEAERFLLRALALAPEQREVNLALADCLRQAGRTEEAQRYQEKLQEIDARLKKGAEELGRGTKAPAPAPRAP